MYNIKYNIRFYSYNNGDFITIITVLVLRDFLITADNNISPRRSAIIIYHRSKAAWYI